MHGTGLFGFTSCFRLRLKINYRKLKKNRHSRKSANGLSAHNEHQDLKVAKDASKKAYVTFGLSVCVHVPRMVLIIEEGITRELQRRKGPFELISIFHFLFILGRIFGRSFSRE